MDSGELEHGADATAGDDAGPGSAGLRKDASGAEPPVVSWVIVEPYFGTRKSDFFACSTPFWIASGTSFALP